MTVKRMRPIHLAFASALFLLGTGSAIADVAYSDKFSGGTSPATSDPYWALASGYCNGYIVTTTISGAVCGGDFTTIYNIASGPGGSGYFLFEGTGYIAATGDQFYISPTFAVTPNTEYTISFDQTNADGYALASIQPNVDGTLLGSPGNTNGDTAAGWAPLSYTWNSGSNTTGQLTLLNYQTDQNGNDFGVTNILVTTTIATPEPGFIVPVALGSCLLGLAAWRRRRSIA